MKLNYKELGDGQPLIILHGVFGSLDNWISVGRKLSETFRVLLIDARNHGLSPHDDQFNLEVMSDDMFELYQDLGLDQAHLIGHSMGGKTAIALAMKYPQLVNRLIVVDIAPKYYKPHHQKIFEAFNHIDLESYSNRGEVDEQMKEVISDPGVRQFLLKNLTRAEDGSFKWKLNLKAIEPNIHEIGKGFDDKVLFNGNTLFLRGDRSDYILDDDIPRISVQFPNSQVKTIQGAGHWVHAEKPVELIHEVESYLNA